MDSSPPITEVRIENFKSIRELSFPCRRVNVFVGEPGSGKSNLLEALGLFSFAYFSRMNYPLSDFVRQKGLSDLFFDRLIDQSLAVRCDGFQFKLGYHNGSFEGSWSSGETQIAQVGGSLQKPTLQVVSSGGLREELGFMRSYRFQASRAMNRPESVFLLPPYGENLVSLFLAHPEVYEEAGRPWENLHLSLNIRLPEMELEIQKRLKRVSTSYPYVLASDTFQRVAFYLAAMRTNRNAVLLLEEPEAHAFPYYTASLAEDIGLDANHNQYFITTHNPYFLLPLVEKTPKDDLAVFVTYMKDYETRLRQLRPRELSNLDQTDLFWNLSKYVPK